MKARASQNPQLGQASSLRALRAAFKKKNNRSNGKLESPQQESTCDHEEDSAAAKGDVVNSSFIARKWSELKRMERDNTSDEIVLQIHAAIKNRLFGKFESSSSSDDDNDDDADEDLAANEYPIARKWKELALMNPDDSFDEIRRQIRAARREAMPWTTIIRSALSCRGRKKKKRRVSRSQDSG